MAFPSITGSVTQTNGTTAATNKTINLPSGILNGEIVCCLMRTAGTGAHTFPAGWNQLFDDASDGSDDQTTFAWYKADSTMGSTMSVSSANNKFAALTWRVSGAADPTVRAPEFATLVTGSGTTPDPGNLTPTGGAKDYLWIWCGGWEGEQTSPPASAPTNYSGTNGADSGTAATVPTNCRVAIASRTNNATSENAGSWTISATDDWTATTVVFHPTEAVTAGLENGRRESSNVLPVKKPLLSVAALTIAVSLLQSTLAPEPPVEDPPTTYEQTTLIISQRPQLQWEYVSLLQTTLAEPEAPAEPPFWQSDWPLPQRRQGILLTDHETVTGEIPAPAVETSPFAQYNWPVPFGKKPVPQSMVRGLDVTYYLVPYRATDLGDIFALPTRRPFSGVRWEHRSYPLFVTETQAPFKQHEWAWFGLREVRQSEQFVNRLGLTSVIESPFSQREWQVYRAILRSNQEQLSSRLLLDTRPFGQAIWDVPVGKRGLNAGFAESLLDSTLQPVAYVITVEAGTILIGASDIQLTWSGEAVVAFRLTLLGVG